MSKSMYDDHWHRPHADHRDEPPCTVVTNGPSGIQVTLDTWGPNDGKTFATILAEAQSNWGEEPVTPMSDEQLTHEDWNVIRCILDGMHLQNALELLSFSFRIEGVTRACTHELVRTRVGASFAQHGGRDNDWRMRKFTRPETVNRAIVEDAGLLPHDLRSAVDLDRYYQSVDSYSKTVQGFQPGYTPAYENMTLEEMEAAVLTMSKMFYAALVDAGVPWQDARRYLPIGSQTYIHANYNYVALRGVIAHRTEHMAVDWEIDCVSQLMVREIYRKCPAVLAHALKSHSDKARVNRFSTLYSWPPNGKHPTPGNYDPDRKTTFRREQAPFWILDPMNLIRYDIPIRWIPTNGEWPWDLYESLYQEAVEWYRFACGATEDLHPALPPLTRP